MVSFEAPAANGLDHVVVLIPAWQPDARLHSLVEQMDACGFGAVLVIDDGSGPAFTSLFEGLRCFASVRLLRQTRNRGKGRAVKDGIDFVRREMPHIQGIVTADADGQHAAGDIVHVADALRGAEGNIVLGAREFTGAAPWRCRMGNWVTRNAFHLLMGVKLADTQTGLRGLPRSLFDELSQLRGERYEYEMAVLAHLCRTGRRPVEVPIEAVYLDGNASSHFRPVQDSARVLVALARSALRP